MTGTIKVTGFQEAEAVLRTMPIELRERYLKKAVREAVRTMTAQSRSIVSAMQTQPLNKYQKDRPRLKDKIVDKQRTYEQGAVIYGVGGPQRGPTGRHAHLVEKGFTHTTGGTLTGSGGKTRKARNNYRTGKGVAGSRIAPRPFIENVAERSKSQVTERITAALRSFASNLKNG